VTAVASPVLVTGTARCVPGRRGEFVDRARRIEAASSSDDGCLYDLFTADLADPDLVESVEVWASSEALQAHLAHDHTREFMAALGALIIGEPKLVSRSL